MIKNAKRILTLAMLPIVLTACSLNPSGSLSSGPSTTVASGERTSAGPITPATIISVENAELNREDLSIFMLVEPDTKSVSLSTSIKVSKDSTWKLFRGENEIGTKVATTRDGELIDGDNIFYVVVSADDGLTENTYVLTIHRSYFATITYLHKGEIVGTDTALTGHEWVLRDISITGYTFSHWTHDGKQVKTIIPWGNLNVDAVTTANSYAVILDPNGGEVENESVLIEYDEEYTLPTPERKGYRFTGWYADDGKTSFPCSGRWSYTSDQKLVAFWEIVYYKIYYKDYDTTTGNTFLLNEAEYTVEDQVELYVPDKSGYTFQGWRDSKGSFLSVIQKGTTGNIYLTATWSGNLNKLIVSSNNESAGTVEIVSGSGRSGEMITVKATPRDGWFFRGWYADRRKVSDNAKYTFAMPVSDYEISAKFLKQKEIEEENLGIRPVLSDDCKLVTYGLYPQNRISDSYTLTKLNSLDESAKGDNGWYRYEGAYYTKSSIWKKITSRFDDGTYIEARKTYWFRCDPIKWRILSYSDGQVFAVSNLLLDVHQYETRIRTSVERNNYAESEIRQWLNADFYNSAFALGSDRIETTTVDNSQSTAGPGPFNYGYAYENTDDKVFLLSYQDYLNADYGFSADTDPDSSRTCKTTDWARLNGAYIVDAYDSKFDGEYWTRSPSNSGSSDVIGVHVFGGFWGFSSDNTDTCIRPALQLSLD